MVCFRNTLQTLAKSMISGMKSHLESSTISSFIRKQSIKVYLCQEKKTALPKHVSSHHGILSIFDDLFRLSQQRLNANLKVLFILVSNCHCFHEDVLFSVMKHHKRVDLEINSEL